jgi:hypothetical protein
MVKWSSAAVVLAVLVVTAMVHVDAQGKPTFSLRASPQVAFVPARIVLTGEFREASNEHEDLYCPEVRWEWGDGTTSSAASDCAPFEPGVSTVKTRYVQTHVFDVPGRFRVVLTLRKGNRVVARSSTTVSVRGGLTAAY